MDIVTSSQEQPFIYRFTESSDDSLTIAKVDPEEQVRKTSQLLTISQNEHFGVTVSHLIRLCLHPDKEEGLYSLAGNKDNIFRYDPNNCDAVETEIGIDNDDDDYSSGDGGDSSDNNSDSDEEGAKTAPKPPKSTYRPTQSSASMIYNASDWDLLGTESRDIALRTTSIQTLIGKFEEIDPSKMPPEKIDRAISDVVAGCQVIQVTYILFVGEIVFAAFTLTETDPILMVLMYRVEPSDLDKFKEVIYFYDNENYIFKKQSIVVKDSLTLIKTALVRLEGMCFAFEGTFSAVSKIKPHGIAME